MPNRISRLTENLTDDELKTCEAVGYERAAKSVLAIRFGVTRRTIYGRLASGLKKIKKNAQRYNIELPRVT